MAFYVVSSAAKTPLRPQVTLHSGVQLLPLLGGAGARGSRLSSSSVGLCSTIRACRRRVTATPQLEDPAMDSHGFTLRVRGDSWFSLAGLVVRVGRLPRVRTRQRHELRRSSFVSIATIIEWDVVSQYPNGLVGERVPDRSGWRCPRAWEAALLSIGLMW